MAPKRSEEVDDDSQMNNAAERAIAKVRAAKEAATEEGVDTGVETLELGGDDEEEEEAAPSGRRERRAERGALHRAAEEHRERAEAAERRAIAAEARAAAIEAVRQQMPPQQREPEADPLLDEHKGLRRQYEGYVARVNQARASKASAEELARLSDEGWDLKDKMDVNAARRAQRGQQPQGGVSPQQLQAQFHRMRIEQDHGDVASGPDADRRMRYFGGQVHALIALGKPDSWDTVAEAMDLTRKAFRLPPKGGRPASSAAVRSKFTGTSRGGAAGSSEGPTTVRVSSDNKKHLEKMANAAMGHLPKEKRMQAYLKQYGGRIAKHLGG